MFVMIVTDSMRYTVGRKISMGDVPTQAYPAPPGHSRYTRVTGRTTAQEGQEGHQKFRVVNTVCPKRTA